MALVAGYGLLGAGWLIWKTEGDLQNRFRHLAARLAWTTLVFIGAVSLAMLFLSTPFRDRWPTLPRAAGANPGMSANVDPQRYPSHGLRFDLRRKSEPLAVFKNRVNASERETPAWPRRPSPTPPDGS